MAFVSEDPALRRQWVLLMSCGCAVGVLEGSEAVDDWEALKEFFPDPHVRRTEYFERGMSLRNISHQTYEDTYLEHMTMEYRCPHQKPQPFWVRVWPGLRKLRPW
jgi:hypothetical protein